MNQVIADHYWVEGTRELSEFVTAVGSCTLPILDPPLHEFVVGQIQEIKTRSSTLFLELMGQPIEVPEQMQIVAGTIQDLEVVLTTLAEHFGRVRTNFYATNVPVDEDLMSARMMAIDSLIENLVYMMEYAEHGALGPLALQV